MRTLIHYTSRDTVLKILENDAFWFIPNDRKVLDRLLPDDDLGEHEPQRFGATSFTSAPVHLGEQVRADFGEYGIAVSGEWAEANGAQPVIYVPRNGPLVADLRELFGAGLDGLRIEEAERAGDPRAKLMGSVPHKRIVGRMGEGALWSVLMTLFEHMEPAENAHQQEWRVVQQEPFHFNEDTKEGHLQEAARDADWPRLRQLEFRPEDVKFLVCPNGEAPQLKADVPYRYRGVLVRTYR